MLRDYNMVSEINFQPLRMWEHTTTLSELNEVLNISNITKTNYIIS